LVAEVVVDFFQEIQLLQMENRVDLVVEGEEQN
jgi:hypothetical protein